ncbi:MAG: tetratricopeptide repeat protein [Nitrosotalea sp.]
MNPDDEKIRIQLNIITRILEKELSTAGFESDFELKQLQISTEIRQKFLPIITLYEQIIKKSPLKEIKKQQNLNIILSGLMNFHYNSKEYSKALEVIEIMLSIIPSNFKIQYSRGRLYELLLQIGKAVECYESVLKIKPDHVSASSHKKSLFMKLKSYNEGMSLLETSQFDEAIICFNGILDLNPKYLPALYHKGVALESLSRFEEALLCYQCIINQNSQYGEVILQVGRILASLERHDEAIKYYDLVLKLNPDNTSALYYKSFSTLKQGNEEELVPLIDHMISLDSRYIKLLESEIEFEKYLKIV